MNSRERVLGVLNRAPVDRTPVDLWYTGEVFEALAAHFGTRDTWELYEKMDLDKICWVFTPYNDPEVTGSPNAAAKRTLWGTELVDIKAGEATYSERGKSPLEDAEGPEFLDDFDKWPDPARFDYEAAAKMAREATSRGYAVLGPWVSFYEIYCGMRGLEKAMMDLAMQPELLTRALDKIEAIQTEMIKGTFEACGDDLDCLFLSDDMGAQNNLFMSLPMWGEFFKPRLKRWCDLAHSYGKKVVYHSDGAMEKLIEPLIECGIDVLNPIQHVCPGMEMEGLKENYGDRLIFYGGVDNQSVLPFGSPDDVRKETRHCLETLGGGGGFIPCSCHNVQAGTPVDNILAMIEAVRSYEPARA